jgi:glycosyltransferase involved in cell wall biosynthesis
MSSIQPATARPLRALLLGPVFSPVEKGGVQVALADLVVELRARGWEIESRISVAPMPASGPTPPAAAWATNAAPPRLSVLDRRPALFAAWISAVPASMRRVISISLKPRAYFERLSHNLQVAEQWLADAQDYDVVLMCTAGAPTGLAALLADRLEHVVMISLFGLREQMRAGWLRWARLVAWWHLRQQLHPFLFRRLAPAKVRLAVFGSAQWRREAVQAGLPANKARTIYFGIPLPEPQPRPPETRHRILAVGRLSPEKGVHHLLRALPLIRQSIGDVTLTIIAGPGPTGYRQVLLDLIKDSNLEAIVTILPGVERAALQAAYATHDILYFYSIFAEPVALVLMEAFAAGLPVVASQSRANARLI